MIERGRKDELKSRRMRSLKDPTRIANNMQQPFEAFVQLRRIFEKSFESHISLPADHMLAAVKHFPGQLPSVKEPWSWRYLSLECKFDLTRVCPFSQAVYLVRNSNNIQFQYCTLFLSEKLSSIMSETPAHKVMAPGEMTPAGPFTSPHRVSFSLPPRRPSSELWPDHPKNKHFGSVNSGVDTNGVNCPSP